MPVVQPGGWKVNIVWDLETTSKDCGWSGRIIAIGFWEFNSTPKVLMDRDEKKLLESFFKILKKDTVLIGFNSDSFDIPYLRLRALRHQIDSSILSSVKSLDLFKVLQSFLPQRESWKRLGDWYQWFGLRNDNDFGGFKMSELWSDQKYELIEEHGLEDIRKTMRLYQILKSCSVV